MNNSFAIVDSRISKKCEIALTERGYSVIKLSPMDILPKPIASHTDIILFRIENTLFLSKKYAAENKSSYELLRSLEKSSIINIALTEEQQCENYPFDAIFNGLVMNGRLFCKSDTFSREIIEFAKKQGYKIVNTKQGYPACTTLKISETAAITADRGMAKTLEAEGISVLTVETGGISLPPYEYGFIGGCGGLCDGTVYFLGDIESHKNKEEIKDFVNKNFCHIESLSDERLSDLGGILFIK
ncbi:MAG: hypothetical protein J6Q68_03890 [Clostridia bacterium]|nr:hypothetical protein [Clostridia bacterium]